MRKQGEQFLKVIAIVLAAAIAAYALISLLKRDGKVSYVIHTASLCEKGDGISVSGYFARDEIILESSQKIIVNELAEGKRVGAGQNVATGYFNNEAREHKEKLNECTALKNQLELALASMSSASADAMDVQIRGQIMELARHTVLGSMDSMSTTASGLRSAALRASLTSADTQKIKDKIAQLNAQIEDLSKQVEGETSVPIPAPESGYYSSTTDGYENILNSDSVMSMDLAGYQKLKEEQLPENTIGKIVTGQTWYYITMIEAEYADRCPLNGYLTVNFPNESLQNIQMKVERIAEAENGKYFLVMSYAKQMQDVTTQREQTADIIFDVFEGLSVPKKALYVVDGETGVYVLENQRTKWKPIEIICELDETYYMVKWDSTDTNKLWPQDDIILTNAELKNRQVINE